jgi:hypothetical protein
MRAIDIGLDVADRSIDVTRDQVETSRSSHYSAVSCRGRHLTASIPRHVGLDDGAACDMKRSRGCAMIAMKKRPRWWMRMAGAFTVPLVGQRVRVVDGVISRIASPRLVVLSDTGPHVPLAADSVAVIVESGSAMITAGEQVTVTGVVHGFVAQQEEVGRPLIGTLTMAERDALRKRPLLIVSSATSFVKR